MKYTSESADRFLSKEDYEEPCCPLSQPSSVTPIPTGRVIEKLDEYLEELRDLGLDEVIGVYQSRYNRFKGE